MGLYLGEQEFIPFSQFMENLEKESGNKIAIKDILKLFVYEKINLFIYIRGDKERILISDREYKTGNDLSISLNYEIDLDREVYFNIPYSAALSKPKHLSYSFKMGYLNINTVSKGDLISRTNFSSKNITILENIFFDGFVKIRWDLELFKSNIDLKISDFIELLALEFSTGLNHPPFFEFIDGENRDFQCFTISYNTESNLISLDYLKDIYLSKKDIEKIRDELDIINILNTKETTIQSAIIEENKKLYTLLEAKNTEILALQEKNKELIKQKKELDLIERDKIALSYKSIIKGLLFIIDKINGKKRIFSSPRGKITTNEISKEILTIIEENPNDFLDDKIRDRTIRKYLGDILKKIEDN